MSHRKPGNRQVQVHTGGKNGLTGRSPATSLAFNGSNASNSGDSGTGSHTYHIPNYATSYASENSHLITVSLGTDQGVYCYMHYVLKTEIMDVASSRPNISSQNFPEENVSCGQSYTSQNVERTKIGERWGELRYGERCLGFHTREYSARLLDMPLLANWKAICGSTPIEIHGQLYEKPERCERQLFVGAVVGYWLVKSEETNCGTSWNRFSDEGCVGKRPGYRLISSRLSNIKGEDINVMCRTTPAMINGIQYDKPTYCINRGFMGIYGKWEVKDPKCSSVGIGWR